MNQNDFSERYSDYETLLRRLGELWPLPNYKLQTIEEARETIKKLERKTWHLQAELDRISSQ